MHITVHMIRKAYGTWQAEREIEGTILQTLLGHVRGSKMTKRVYINPQGEARNRAVFELPVPEQGQNENTELLATFGNKPQLAPKPD